MPVDNSIQDLTGYLARPVAIASGTITAGFVGNLLKSYYDGNTIVTAFPNFKNRVLGAFGFRATMVFTLQVSSTPFHQGVVALSYQYGAPNTAGVTYERCSNSCTCTNLPHARLDLASETMVQLKVPYMSSVEYTPIENVTNTIHGLLGLNVILPTPSVTGLSAPVYQIYLHLEDVEFFGAAPYAYTTVVLQSHGRLKGVSAEFEDESRPMSSAVHALSRTVKWVSKGIPALSSIGGPTSWFLEKAAGAIRAFGFSRPQVTDPVMRMTRVDNLNEQNVDNALAVSVVAPFSSNMLKTGPEFAGTDVDEMSMRYVLSQWSQLNRFVLDTTAAVNNLVYVTPISPCVFTYRHRTTTTLPYCNRPAPAVAPTGYNSFQPTTLMFFGQMFKFWRGSVKFRFTFAKTKMHGGRVMVSYTPSNHPNGEEWLTTPSWTVYVPSMSGASPNPFGHSAIFNLRDGNVFEFVVPYISPRPYSTYSAMTGSLTMHVVDPLIAPPTVADSIGVLVEVCGGEDFEFADPHTPLYPVHINSPTVSFQSGEVLSQAPDELSQFTMGEAITSVKQLISIPSSTYDVCLETENYTEYAIAPWFYQPRPATTPTAPATHLNCSFSFGGNIAACYAFVKGGTDFHAYDPQNSFCHMTVTQHSNAYSYRNSYNSPANMPVSSNPRVYTGTGRSLHVRLPAYQATVRLFSWAANVLSDIGRSWSPADQNIPTYSTNFNTPASTYVVRRYEAINNPAMFSRAAADDAALAHYMGPPPLVLLSSISTLGKYDPDSDPTHY